MIAVLVQALLFASSGMLSIGSITLTMLLLMSDRGWHNGLAYALGYGSTYAVIGVISIALGQRTIEENGYSRDLVFSILLIALGITMFWLSYHNWHKPQTQKDEQPRFISIVNKISPPKAFGFGLLVPIINIKNLALFLSAQSVVILSDLAIIEKLLITIAIVPVFCLSVIAPVLIYIIFPGRAMSLLNSIKDFLRRKSRPIGILGPLIFGCLFLFKGIWEVL